MSKYQCAECGQDLELEDTCACHEEARAQLRATVESQAQRIAGLLVDVEAQAQKINELDLWKRMHDMAPVGAKAAVVERMQQAEAIQPFIESWKRKCADQAQRIAELERLAERAPIVVERDRHGISRCPKCDAALELHFACPCYELPPRELRAKVAELERVIVDYCAVAIPCRGVEPALCPTLDPIDCYKCPSTRIRDTANAINQRKEGAMD